MILIFLAFFLIGDIFEFGVLNLFDHAINRQYKVGDEKEEENALYDHRADVIVTGHSSGGGQVIDVRYAFVGGFKESFEGKFNHSSL